MRREKPASFQTQTKDGRVARNVGPEAAHDHEVLWSKVGI